MVLSWRLNSASFSYTLTRSITPGGWNLAAVMRFWQFWSSLRICSCLWILDISWALAAVVIR